jgi:uncharacterized membrane protein SpoIIM required for sporulation
MKEGAFEQQNAARWKELDQLVDALESGRVDPRAADLPRRFREVCADLALARSRVYGLALVERLNTLVIRCHRVLYRGGGIRWEMVARFLAGGFSARVRAEWRLFWFCSALFWLPFFALLVSVRADVGWVQAVLGQEGMAAMEQMYGGEQQQLAHLRSEYGSNFMMFCHYIQNNVGIDFRIFAGGMAAGLGTVFFLLFNGVYIGAAAGYANYACDPVAFWSFVSSHSAPELVGMVVAGMAGMRLGLGILKPGRLPRRRAIAVAAKQALPLVAGAGLLTTAAAVVEGFWSAQALPPAVKYAAGITGWVLVGAWLLWAGRGRGAAT